MSASLPVIRDDRLPILAAQINQAHDMASRSAQAAISHAIAVGEGLIEAKALVGHGEWLPWLSENFDFSERTAQKYIRLAKHRDEVQSNTKEPSYLAIDEALKHIGKANPQRVADSPIRAVAPSESALQEERDRQREEHKAKLPAFVAEREAAKEASKKAGDDAGVSDADRIDELEAAVIALENENAKIQAELREYESLKLMFSEWEAGGWEAVIAKKTADLVEQIRVLNRRVERESSEKVRNLNDMERWKKRAIKLGWTNHVIIPLDKNTA
jgi:hypothetical protein